MDVLGSVCGDQFGDGRRRGIYSIFEVCQVLVLCIINSFSPSTSLGHYEVKAEMAESEVKAAALFLGKLLVEEINYLDGVRDKVEELQTELNSLESFLAISVKTRHQDDVVRNALSDARCIAYDCQDTIETYILGVARHGYEEYEGCQLGSAMRWACVAVNARSVLKLHSQIGSLFRRISALKTTMASFGVPQRMLAAEKKAADRYPLKRIYSHESEEYVVVGIDNHLDELVGRLVDQTTNHTIIALCGMGGIGKSTLARELYHHPKIRGGGYFEASGWVHVSQQFQPETVLKTLIYSLIPENDHVSRRKADDDITSGHTHKALYDLMKQVKCLVVVDDIWCSNDWERLEAAFPRKNPTGSKILLTTRNEETVSRLDPTLVYLHAIKGFDATKSWELFEKIAFSGATCNHSGKGELGREMLQHCNGVPLAIVVLGKVLKAKESVEDWNRMRSDISAQIKRGGTSEPYKEVYDVLRVSYDELPFHLKHCFLQLANFPEDYEISTEKLFSLWVAEGIVSNSEYGPNELEEDVAERYLNELVGRNMVQVSTWRNRTRRIETCRLHDLMRDICIEMAKNDGFLQTINCQPPMLLTSHAYGDHILTTSLPKRDKRMHRLAVCVSDEEPHSSSVTKSVAMASANVSRAPNLRSFLLFSINEKEGNEIGEKFVETISEDFPLLRVLSCENLKIMGKLPEKVGNLSRLMYLGLFNTCVTELPFSIDKLHWLQTLDLRVRPDVVISLPNVLWKMKQLRHVFLPLQTGIAMTRLDGPFKYEIIGAEMLRLDGLRFLQTIINLDLDRVELQGLSNLESLNTVVATCESNRHALHLFIQCKSMRSFNLRLHAQILNEDPMILSSCQALHQLDLHVVYDYRVCLKQPLCLQMLPNSLVYIRIWYIQLADDPLPVLEKLPNLIDLDFHVCYSGRKMSCSSTGFPELKSLCFDGLFRFRDWEVEQGALQNLQNLVIFNCAVKKIPNAIPRSVNLNTIGSTIAVWDIDMKDVVDDGAKSDDDQASQAVSDPSTSSSATVTEKGNSDSIGSPSAVVEPPECEGKLPYNDHEGFKCKFCDRMIRSFTNKGSSCVESHVKRCEKYHDQIQKQMDLDERMKYFTDPKLCQFSEESIIKALARMIIVDALPLTFVQQEGFRAFCRLLNTEFCVPSREIVATECYDLFMDESKKIKSTIHKLSSRVSLTINAWTSGQSLSYLDLTAHFIDDDWKLHKRIINICPIADHSTEHVGKVVEKCLLGWGITKVMAITSTNALSDDNIFQHLHSGINHLRDNLPDCIFLHIRCATQIISIIARDGLRDIDTSVRKVRAAVRYVTSSPTTLEKFKACLHEEKIECRDDVCLDNNTRWDSTFLMLDCAVKFRKEFDNLHSRGGAYVEELQKFGGAPCGHDWEKVSYLLPFLRIFHNATLDLSSRCYATSNYYVPHIYGVGDSISTYCKSKDMVMRDIALQMKAQFDKYWGDALNLNILLFVALVLDPRYKLGYVEWIIKEAYDDERAGILCSSIKDTLQSLIDTYESILLQSQKRSEISASAEIDQVLDVQRHLKLKHKMGMKMAEAREKKTELEKYLDYECELDDTDFDILQWWKDHQRRYPTLATIARDVFAIPVSTVSFESAFDTEGCVHDPLRTCSTPKMVEAMVCSNDWLRISNPLMSSDDSFLESNDFDQGIQELSSEEPIVGNNQCVSRGGDA